MLRWRLILCLAIGLLAPGIRSAWAEPAAPQSGEIKSGKSQSLPPQSFDVDDDQPEPFVPLKPKTDADRNRIEALSLFAAGRTEEERGNYPAALRMYQRALQFDPRSLPILKQVIEVARTLNRKAEYMRYALVAVELDPSDLQLLAELADYLLQQNDLENALRLYERGREKTRPGSAPYLSLTMRIGRLAFATGRAQAAAAAFAEVMRVVEAPGHGGLTKAQLRTVIGSEGRSYDLMGEAFLSADRPDDALKAFEKSQQVAPDKAGFAFNRAQVFAKKKQYDKALEQLEVYFESKQTSQDVSPYQLLSSLLSAAGRQRELLPRLEKLYAADRENVPLAYFLAIEYRYANEFAKAEPLYQDLLKRAPKLEAYRGLVDVYRRTAKAEPLMNLLAQLAAKAGSLDAVSSEATAIAADPKLFDELVPLAKKLGQERGDQGFGASLAMASIAMDAQRWELAGEFFNAAIALRPRAMPELLLAWGTGLLTANQPQRAVTVFRRAVEDRAVPSDNPVFQIYLAVSLEMSGRTDEALRAGHLAAKMSDNAPRVLSRVAWILFHAKRYDEAEKSYREFIARFDSDFKDDDVREQLKEARLVLSSIYVTQHQVPKAEEVLLQVLDEYPDDIGALNDLGYLWADQGKNLERALKMIRQAVAAEPKNYAYRDSLGWVYYKLGRYNEAVDELKQAVHDKDSDGTVLDHLADAYSAAGRKAEARDAWRRAAEMLKQQGEAEKAQAVEAKMRKNADK